MQTIPDSNVLLDLMAANAQFGEWSRRKLVECALKGQLITNAVVFSESSATFSVWQDAAKIFDELQLVYEDIEKDVAHLAGRVHADYRRQGGLRERTLPDFFIGAHAAVNNYRILTRDSRRYRTYFPEVEIIAPDTHP
jgi:predicted nucleic acid-binding protein